MDKQIKIKNMLILLFIILLGVQLAFAEEVKIELHEGWNILPVPLNLKSNDIGEVLKPILSNVLLVREYREDGVKVYDPSIPFRFNTLTTIESGKAYQVKMKAAATLPLEGVALVKEQRKVNLHTRWNLVPYLGDQSYSVEEVMAQIKDKVSIIREYTESGVKVYDPSIPERFNTLKIFNPSRGYQIRMKENAELQFPSLDVPQIGENLKDESKYTPKQAFLISDLNWKDVLPLVSVTTWTGSEDWCQRGYGTPENVCAYPTLIYHDETEQLEYLSFTNSFLNPSYIKINGERYSEWKNKFSLKAIFEPQLLKLNDQLNVGFEISSVDDNYDNAAIDTIEISWPFNDNLPLNNGKSLLINVNDKLTGSTLFFGPNSDTPSFTYKKYMTSGFDIDSIIYFFQQYEPDRLSIVGKTAQDIDNLLVAEPEFGAGLNENNLGRMTLRDYLTYWKSFEDVVYVEGDYESALVASAYASLINAPLIIQGSDLDNEAILNGRNVICVGNVNNKCNDRYSLEQLQTKYLEMKNNHKLVLTNPNDLSLKETGSFFGTEKGNRPLLDTYTKTSLISPFLSGAKQELLLTTTLTDYNKIDDFVTFKAKKSFDYNLYVCELGESCSDGFETYSKAFFKPVNSKEITLKLPIGANNANLEFSGYLVDCRGKKQVSLFNNNKHLGDADVSCSDDIPLNFYSSDRFRGIYYQGINKIEPGEIKLKFDGGTWLINPDLVLEVYSLGDQKIAYSCNFSDAECRPKTEEIVYNNKLSKNVTNYYYNNITPQDYNVFITFISSLSQIDGVYINDELILKVDRRTQNFIHLKLPKDKITENFKITIQAEPSDIYERSSHFFTEDSLFYNAEVDLVPASLADDYLTIIGAPNAIPYKERMDSFRDGMFVFDVSRSLDQTQYADINGDFIPDISTGRIQGISSSDVSSNVARTLFFNKIPRTNNIEFMASFVNRQLGDIIFAKKMGNELSNVGYNIFLDVHPEEDVFFGKPSMWSEKDFISYSDHGNENIAGISSDRIPLLSNSVVVNNACLTCSSFDHQSFCNTVIRKGGIGHYGAASVSFSSNSIPEHVIESIYYDDSSLGKALAKSYAENFRYLDSSYMTMLLGDPTFELNPPYLLNR